MKKKMEEFMELSEINAVKFDLFVVQSFCEAYVLVYSYGKFPTVSDWFDCLDILSCLSGSGIIWC